jgi:hypothetical protein
MMQTLLLKAKLLIKERMQNMKRKKSIAAVLLVGLVIGGLAIGVLSSRLPLKVNAARPAQGGDHANEAGQVGDDDGDEAGEAEESVSPTLANITPAEARAAAEAAYPGTKALKVELMKENGLIAYEVELDNGLELLIDHTNGSFLGIDDAE